MFNIENGADNATASVTRLGIPSSQTCHLRGGKEMKCCVGAFKWAEQQLKSKVGKHKSPVKLTYFNTRLKINGYVILKTKLEKH